MRSVKSPAGGRIEKPEVPSSSLDRARRRVARPAVVSSRFWSKSAPKAAYSEQLLGVAAGGGQVAAALHVGEEAEPEARSGGHAPPRTTSGAARRAAVCTF